MSYENFDATLHATSSDDETPLITSLILIHRLQSKHVRTASDTDQDGGKRAKTADSSTTGVSTQSNVNEVSNYFVSSYQY